MLKVESQFHILNDRDVYLILFYFQNISLELLVLDWDRMTKNEVIGRLELGLKCEGQEASHWSEVINCPRKQIAEWHKLQDQVATSQNQKVLFSAKTQCFRVFPQTTGICVFKDTHFSYFIKGQYLNKKSSKIIKQISGLPSLPRSCKFTF